MNVKNNQRFQENERKIRECLIRLLDTMDIDHITVRMICENAGIHRSTFYTHYEDVCDLLHKTEAVMNRKLFNEMKEIMQDERFFRHPAYYIRFLKYMEQNQPFYRACLKKRYSFPIAKDLDPIFETVIKPAFIKNNIFDEDEMLYYFTFYQAGVTMICKKWIAGGCKEPAETIADYIVHCINSPHLYP